MSKQRRYQERMIREGRCMLCGDQAYVKCYCKRHYEERQQKLREQSEAKGSMKMCSYCGEYGHNIRGCPHYKSNQTRKLSVAAIKRILKRARKGASESSLA